MGGDYSNLLGDNTALKPFPLLFEIIRYSLIFCDLSSGKSITLTDEVSFETIFSVIVELSLWPLVSSSSPSSSPPLSFMLSVGTLGVLTFSIYVAIAVYDRYLEATSLLTIVCIWSRNSWTLFRVVFCPSNRSLFVTLGASAGFASASFQPMSFLGSWICFIIYFCYVSSNTVRMDLI